RVEGGTCRRRGAPCGGGDLRARGARLPRVRPGGGGVKSVVTLAIPCRTDEPALGRTLSAAVESWRRAPESRDHALDVLVCLNGPGGDGPRSELAAFARAAGVGLTQVDVDRLDRPAASP